MGGIDEEIVLEPRKSDFFVNKKVRDVGCGLRHTVFVLDDGTVYTCGCNDLGQLGHEKSRKKPGKGDFLFPIIDHFTPEMVFYMTSVNPKLSGFFKI